MYMYNYYTCTCTRILHTCTCIHCVSPLPLYDLLVANVTQKVGVVRLSIATPLNLPSIVLT